MADMKFDTALLTKMYPRFAQNESFYLNRFTHATTEFKKTFGTSENLRYFSAPGRTEIGGNHTDHQRGNVLAAAIDLDLIAVVATNGTRNVRILSEGYRMTTISLDDLMLNPAEYNTSDALIKGIAHRIGELGYTVEGFDLFATSNVLKGSGLSSSAAFEVLIGTVMNHMFCDGNISAVEVAQIGQYAENVYFGKPCGLMDQMASSVGSAVAIDFKNVKNPVVRKVEFDLAAHNYALCIIDSGADHADLTDEYAAIPQEMGSICAYFGREVLSDLTRDAIMERLPALRKQCGDRAVLRAIHYFDDNEKAIAEAKALECNDFDGFLKLVTASGTSSYKHLQNVTVAGATTYQEVGVSLMLCEQLLGGRGAYRVHGGGFAGTVQAFVPNDLLDTFKAGIEAVLGEGSCHVLSIRMVGGVEVK